MEGKAVMKFARVTPTKARMVANLIRNKDVAEVREICDVVPRKASTLWKKLIDSAYANLSEKMGVKELDPGLVVVKEIFADKAVIMKRWETRSQGRAYRIQKFTSHLTVIVAER